jgi:Ca-activated chloride channel family protein
MTSRPLISFITYLVTVLFVVSGVVPGARAQSTAEDVHVTPRQQPTAKNDRLAEDPPNTNITDIKVNVNLVLVSVSVVDGLDRQVTGLDKQNFEVSEGKERQQIKYFSAEDAPISVGAIFDVSGSMAGKIERARDALLEFVKIANPQDEFFMIAFADKPEEISDFTQSVGDIQSRLVYTVPKGRTALLDAIYLSLHKMSHARYQKKALLIISDGGDNHSRYTENDIKNLVKESDVQIYAIGLYDHYFQTEEERLGPELLQDITELTGGRAFSIDNPNDLPDVAAKIGIELRNQYVLGYQPTKPAYDGKWHKIKVKLDPPKGLPSLRVYAKAGYYARSE